MRIRAFVISVALLLAIPSIAHARCTEVSDVTGEKKCSRFGSKWSLEGEVPLIFRFGIRYSQVTTDDLSFQSIRTKDTSSMEFRLPGRSFGFKALTGVSADGGFGFFVWGQLYTGLESHFSGGQVTTRASTVQAQGQTLRLTQDGGINTFAYGGAIPLGYRIPLGRVSIRPEMAFGLDAIEISQHVTLPNGHEWTGTAMGSRAIIEPRVAAELWFTGHIALSVAAGVNLIGGNTDRSLGISLAWHLRAFDGASAF